MNFRTRPRRPAAELAITPLIDVVFQLLIFFLLTTSFVTESTLEVELPTADTSAVRTEPKRVVVLDVGADGRVALGPDVLDLDDLEALFQQMVSDTRPGDAQPTVLLRADRRTPHGEVVRVMDRALRQRLTRIAIATRDEADAASP